MSQDVIRFDVPDDEADPAPAPEPAIDPAAQAVFNALQPTAGKPGSAPVNALSELWKQPLGKQAEKATAPEKVTTAAPTRLSDLWKRPLQ